MSACSVAAPISPSGTLESGPDVVCLATLYGTHIYVYSGTCRKVKSHIKRRKYSFPNFHVVDALRCIRVFFSNPSSPLELLERERHDTKPTLRLSICHERIGSCSTACKTRKELRFKRVLEVDTPVPILSATYLKANVDASSAQID